MSHTYHIPRRFHPGWSLLGRLLCRTTGDRLQAEAFQVIVLTGSVLLLILGHYLIGALVAPAPLLRWGIEAGLLALLVLAGVWGHQPATTITCTPDALQVEQGQRRLVLRYDEIEAFEAISPLVFHRHHRRYAAMRAFTDRLSGDLLLLKTAHGPVVLGLASDDHAAFRTCLKRKCLTEKTHTSPST